MPKLTDKTSILAGRVAVDAYREAHRKLHEKAYYRGVHADHTPLLNTMLDKFKGQGFNSIQEFYSANREYCLDEAGFRSTPVFQSRQDILLIESAGLVLSNGVEIFIASNEKETFGKLIIDPQLWMTTSEREHASMTIAIRDCPPNAKVLIGGLGLGLVLLYLASFGSTREVVVMEREQRLVDLIGDNFLAWFASEYPDFKLQIIVGDVLNTAGITDKFDWIFIDVADSPLEEPTPMDGYTPCLTETGKTTIWLPFTSEWE